MRLVLTRPPMTRAYALGLGYGAVWLVVVGLAFGLVDLITLNTTVGGMVLSLVGVLLTGAALLGLCARFLRLAWTAPPTEASRLSVRGRRLFGGLIVLETVGWTVLNVTLVQRQHQVWIVPLDLILIGAHFIPLAFVFRVPSYFLMGSFWILAIVGTMRIWPASVVIGRASAWTTLPSVSYIAITWLTVFFLLARETTRLRGGLPRP